MLDCHGKARLRQLKEQLSQVTISAGDTVSVEGYNAVVSYGPDQDSYYKVVYSEGGEIGWFTSEEMTKVLVLPLPSGWEEAIDPASGNPYYFNRANGETTWQRPQVALGGAVSSRGGGGGQPASSSTVAPPPQPPPEPSEVDILCSELLAQVQLRSRESYEEALRLSERIIDLEPGNAMVHEYQVLINMFLREMDERTREAVDHDLDPARTPSEVSTESEEDSFSEGVVEDDDAVGDRGSGDERDSLVSEVATEPPDSLPASPAGGSVERKNRLV